jgi:hypothetical protein
MAEENGPLAIVLNRPMSALRSLRARSTRTPTPGEARQGRGLRILGKAS